MTIEEFKQGKKELKETLSNAVQDFLDKYDCDNIDIKITLETVEYTGVNAFNTKSNVVCRTQYPKIKITTEI